MTWDQIVLDDRFRGADPGTQAQIRMHWLTNVAPTMYPELQASPFAAMQLMQYMSAAELPGKLPDEDDIIRPESVNIDGFSKLESNPAYRRKSWKDQTTYKEIWFRKMAATDPYFQQMDPSQQEAFHRRLQTRAPAIESSQLMPTFSPDEWAERENQWTKARWGTVRFLTNLEGSFVRAFGSLILGPIRWMANDESPIEQLFRDAEKQREYINFMGQDSSNFLTGVVPNIVGYGLGVVAPGSLFKGLDKLLGGTTTTAGLVERAGTAIGLKAVPRVAYGTAGGATAGVFQGITEAMKERQPWHTYLPQDVSIGVATEFLSRYIGGLRQIRRQAQSLGVTPKDMFASKTIGTGSPLSPELRTILEANPELRSIYNMGTALDQSGLPIANRQSRAGVAATAQVYGWRPQFDEEALRIVDSQGKMVQEFTGPEMVRFDKAVNWMDNSERAAEVFKETAGGKHITELIAMSPHVEMRVGTQVPEGARRIILRHIKDHNVPFDFSLDRQRGIAELDNIYGMIRKQSSQKAATTLAQVGVIFDPDPADNIRTIEQIKGEIDELLPEHQFYIINKRTGKPVRTEDMPSVFISSKTLKQPMVFQNVYAGNPASIRKTLSTLRKKYADIGRAVSQVANKGGMTITQKLDTQVVELIVNVPKADGTMMAQTLRFPSLKRAHEALTLGTNKGYTRVISHVFGDNKQLRASYDEYLKHMRKVDLGKYGTDYMPYAFAAGVAEQNGYYLGVRNGKYVLQDLIDDSGNFRQDVFDNINDVVERLNEVRADIENLPDFARGVKRSAAEYLDPDVTRDPMRDIGPEAFKRTGKFGIATWLATQVGPPQYVMQRLNKLGTAKYLEDTYGFSLTRVHNNIEQTNQLFNSWQNERRVFVRGLKKGMNRADSKFIIRWLQALDTAAEAEAAVNLGMPLRNYEIKADVLQEAESVVGATKAQRIEEVGTQIRRYLDEMFGHSGLSSDNFVKHYFPHLRDEVGKNAGTGVYLHPDRLTNIPETDRKFFFELIREADPGQFLYDDDVFRTLEVYTHLMGRKLFIRPYMTKLARDIENMTKQVTRGGTEPSDYKAIIHYVGELMRSIEGVDVPDDRIFRMASENTLDSIAEMTGKKWNAKKPDLMRQLITLTTGAHLAARPYTVFRNLTQSMITGGSLIDMRWWQEGVERTLRPGGLEQVKALGIFKEHMIPTAAGSLIEEGDILGKAVHVTMGPYKWADSVNRAIVYHGMMARMENAIDLLKAGKITKQRFLKLSGARLFGKDQLSEGSRLINTAVDPNYTAFKNHFANLAVARSQYLYNSFDQPQAFRSGLGRYFGQYTSWPINFLSLVKERLVTDSLTVGEKVAFLGRLGATTTAIGTALWSVGVNPKSFAPWNMGSVQGGPWFQLLNDSLRAANGDPVAYRTVVRFLTSVAPFAYEGEGIMRAIQAYQDGDPWEAFLHLASAPVRYDLYPRREIVTDRLEQTLMRAGNAYFQARNYSIPAGVLGEPQP